MHHGSSFIGTDLDDNTCFVHWRNSQCSRLCGPFHKQTTSFLYWFLFVMDFPWIMANEKCFLFIFVGFLLISVAWKKILTSGWFLSALAVTYSLCDWTFWAVISAYFILLSLILNLVLQICCFSQFVMHWNIFSLEKAIMYFTVTNTTHHTNYRINPYFLFL